MANLLATRLPQLSAAVPFYGSPAPLDRVHAIRARLMFHFSGNDERINASWPAYRERLQAAGVKFEYFTYPNTQHGFNNDTTPVSTRTRRLSRGSARSRSWGGRCAMPVEQEEGPHRCGPSRHC